MNFDDLHDPQPPRPGPATLAAVTGRARRIRRRRTTLAVAGGLAALAAVVVPAALVATGEGGGDRIVPADPSTTVVPAPTVPVTVPAPTVAPTVPAPPAPSPLAVAILANGDAVVVADDGTAALAYDGADPQDPPVEGEMTAVDSVVRTADGRVFVSTCCEPVPGSWFEVDASGAPSSDVHVGHGLALSPGGDRIASVGASGITVSDLDGTVVASADLSAATPYRQPERVMWLDADTLAVIELRQTDAGTDEFHLLTLDAALTGAATARSVVIGTDIEATWPRFGGVAADGSILVYRGERAGDVSNRLEAHDAATLAPRPDSDIVIADEMAAVDAWYADGVVTFVGIDDTLHVGDLVLPDDATVPSASREYAWARPTG
jgi:hypothetical protein